MMAHILQHLFRLPGRHYRVRVVRRCVGLIALLLVLAGCGTMRFEARMLPPDAATATAEAASDRSPEQTKGSVVFVRAGDVWRVNLDSGEEVRVTDGGGYERPHWSSTGDWISFFRGPELWVAPAAGGDPRRLVDNAASVRWSPVADQLAYVSGGGLALLDVGTGETNELVPAMGSRGGVGTVRWSPGGQWLAFDWTERENEGAPPVAQGIDRIRADGTMRSEIFSAYDLPRRDDTARLHSWSPDGTRIVFWQIPHNSASLAADGVPLKSVPANGGVSHILDERVLVHSDFVRWSPDGTRLAVVAGGGRQTSRNKTLMLTSPDGQESDPLTPLNYVALSPTWSPDGQYLAYVAATEASDARTASAAHRIWTVAPETSTTRKLTNDATYRDEHPVWSTTGDLILFLRLQGQPPDIGAGLWLMRTDGSDLHPVVDELSPLPDPDGYHGYTDWATRFDWWTGPSQPQVPVQVPLPTSTAVQELTSTVTAVPAAASTLGTSQVYTNPSLDIAFDIPESWTAEETQNQEVHVVGNASQTVLRLVPFGPDIATLDAALTEIEQSEWGLYLRTAESVELGSLNAMRVTLAEGDERPSVFWLVMTPMGRVTQFIPESESSVVEQVLATLRAYE